MGREGGKGGGGRGRVGLTMPGSPTPTYVDFEKFQDECTNMGQ